VVESAHRMSIHLAALGFLAVASGAGARPGPARALDDGLVAHAAGAARAVFASGVLRGAPSLPSPLGEGVPPDADPRFRLDAFDCVTLVETAIALGNARSTAQAEALLDDIRYQGTPDFTHRNHYLEAQWLPANVAKGWIEEATFAVAGDLALAGEVRHALPRWQAAARAGRLIPGLDPAALPVGAFPLPFVPLDHVAEVADRIPDGTVLLVVRADRPRRPYRVTHLGVVVVGPGGRRLVRHASDVPGVMRVRDEPLFRFAARLARQRAWPVVGVSLWAIRDNGERARHLLERPRAGSSPPR